MIEAGGMRLKNSEKVLSLPADLPFSVLLMARCYFLQGKISFSSVIYGNHLSVLRLH